MFPDTEAVELGVSEFVALLNQTLEFAYPSVIITGELANLRVSKNRWVYFDLKDELSSVKCFGVVYQLPGPLEDGMLLKVRGQPRLHNLYGFSFNFTNIQPAGEGSIRRAADLLKSKLAAEGLFDEARKRPLPYPPRSVGLITSKQSAAYADFTKILNARWSGLNIQLIDVQVQGEMAPSQIVAALEQFSSMAEPPEVLVLIRGGGSAEDLATFSVEAVTRAVAASRVPTLVAIGHEIDLSLAELAADMRASTPSNAAELLVADKAHELTMLRDSRRHLGQYLSQSAKDARRQLVEAGQAFHETMKRLFTEERQLLDLKRQLLAVFDPRAVLQRGYAIIRDEAGLVTSVKSLKVGKSLSLELRDGSAGVDITDIKPKQ